MDSPSENRTLDIMLFMKKLVTACCSSVTSVLMVSVTAGVYSYRGDRDNEDPGLEIRKRDSDLVWHDH